MGNNDFVGFSMGLGRTVEESQNACGVVSLDRNANVGLGGGDDELNSAGRSSVFYAALNPVVDSKESNCFKLFLSSSLQQQSNFST